MLTTSILFYLSYIALTIYNYQREKDLLVTRMIERELPTTADRIGKVINARITSGSDLVSTATTSPFLIDWIQAGEADVTAVTNHILRVREAMNFRYIGFASDRTGMMYNHRGRFSNINENPLWFETIKNSSQDLRIEINDNVAGKRYLWLDQKIKDFDGNFLGVFWAGIPLSELGDLVTELQIGQQGSTYLVNMEGDIKIHRNKELVMLESEKDSTKNIKYIEGIADVSAAILTSKDTAVNFTRGEGIFYVHTRFVPLLDWYIVVEACGSELLAPLDEQFSRSMILGLVILIITTFISLVLVNRVVIFPLRSLQSNLLQFFDFLKRKTDHIQLRDTKRMDEIGSMTRQINDNVRQIEEGITKDNSLITEVQTLLESLRTGQIKQLLEGDPGNPELKKLKQNFNQVIWLFKKKVGTDINAILEVLEDYGRMDFEKTLLNREGEIERKVLEMGKDLKEKNAQLVAKKELERANQELVQFAHITSHDLKSPLRGIGNIAGMILAENEGQLKPDIVRDLKLLEGRAKWMEALIDNILEYSKAGFREGEKEICDLNQILTDCIKSIDNGNDLNIVVKDILPTLVGYRIDWHRVFQNLIENAIKYNDKDHPQVEISYRAVNGLHEFQVSDNGPGIDPRHHEKVFKMFQSLHSRSKSKGSGIGLAIVKKIIELNKGRIWIDSENSIGTTFLFTITK